MKRKILKYTLLVGAAVVIFSAGVFATRNDFGLGRNMEIMVNFMHAISNNYVDKVDADEVSAEVACDMLCRISYYLVEVAQLGPSTEREVGSEVTA